MKRIPGMKSKSFAHSFAAILLGSASLFLVTSANSDTRGQTAGGLSFVSGGIGLESRQSLTGDFNLKLVFALKSGEYVSDVRVAIADAAGKSVLDTTSDGPWFLAKLPAGSYQISATFEGNAVRRKITVDAAKLRTIDLRWAAE